MFICYDENAKSAFTGRLSNVDPNKAYLKHFANKLYIAFVMKHPESTVQERAQASRELAIADRKMTYWERNPEFSLAAIDTDMQKLKALWATGGNRHG
jgi:hypothetical protein